MEIRRLIALATLFAFLAAAPPAHAVAQRTGDFELEIDAPWRMEPRGSASSYGAIPIQISIHDADQPVTPYDRFLQQLIGVKQTGGNTVNMIGSVLLTFLAGPIADVLEGLDSAIEWVLGFEVLPYDSFPRVVTLDRFQSLTISEEIDGRWVPRQIFTLGNVHEVERTIGLWRWAADQTGPEVPGSPPARPAWSLCRRWAGEDCSGFAPLRPTSEWHATAMYSPATTAPGADVRLRAELRVSTVEDGDAYTKTYTRVLSVHLGEAALPRFDANWAYGDLHYHSQGTDNDGESAYAYRGVLQAMSAMGMDFAFATDHASNSPQIGSAAPIPTDQLILPIMRGLRDMSPDRFAFNLDLLNAPTGGNRQVTSYPRGNGSGLLAAPQLFLGGELDVIPERSTSEYGPAINPCGDIPTLLAALDQFTPYPDKGYCSGMLVQVGDRLLARDLQGPDDGDFLSKDFFARQHLLHLPTDPRRHDAFIASNTSKYGGATRRLGEILDVELGQRQKGFVFLAHPFAHASGDGFGRVGPDLMRYSISQLQDAFSSPHVLGLQLWNENSVFTASADDRHPFQAPLWTGQRQQRCCDFFWDLMQLWGLDPARTSQLAWLPAGQPRRVLMAGGSDAHGDLNYRREGHFLGTESVSETALGKPRNLLRVGAPDGQPLQTAAGIAKPISQAQVVNALRSGNFSVTDGPALRIAIDANGNGAIDESDVPMGGLSPRTSEGPFDVIVEWKSTPEFAAVRQIDLYLGVHAEGHLDGMMYLPFRAPQGWEGSRPEDIGGAVSFTQPDTGKTFVRTPHPWYWYDPTGSALAIDPLPGEEYEGRRVVRIDPAQFPIGEGVCVYESTTPFYSTTTRTLSGALALTESLAVYDPGTVSDPLEPIGPTDPIDPVEPTTTVVEMKISPDKLLDQIVNGGVIDPPPPCDRFEFHNGERADRMFIRATVRNHLIPGSATDCVDAPWSDQTQCVYRQAHTNPVWVTITPCENRLQCNAVDLGSLEGVELEVAPPAPSLPVDPSLYDSLMPDVQLLEQTRDADSDGIADEADNCPFTANPGQSDVDASGRGDACECGDQDGDGRLGVADIVAINRALFNPALAGELCDANNDGLCNVGDIVALNADLFSAGNTTTCARQPVVGP